MRSLISGQAGLAIILKGTYAIVYENAEEEAESVDITHVPLLLSGAHDVQAIETPTDDEVKAALRRACDSEHALLMALVLIDPEEEKETRQLALVELERLLAGSAETYDFVAARLCSRPMPPGEVHSQIQKESESTAAVHARSSLAETLEALEGTDASQTRSLLAEVESLQPKITAFWTRWTEIPKAVFTAPYDRERLLRIFSGSSVIGRLARASDSRARFDAMQIRLVHELRRIPPAQRIIASLVQGMRPAAEQRTRIQEIESDVSDRTEPAKFEQGFDEIIAEVAARKEQINAEILAGHDSKATELVRALVDWQLTTGAPKHAAKSLCDLANTAKDVGNLSLQLQMLQEAVGLSPKDGRAHSQLAYALLALNRIGEASKAFVNAGMCGEIDVARGGEARVLRAQGKLAESAAVYSKVIGELGPSVHTMQGLAEVYRDMWEFDKATAVYRRAVREFPDESRIWCGLAATLADAGDLVGAIETYDDSISRFPEAHVPRCGRAGVLLELGFIQEARDAYQQLVDDAPGDSVAWCGLAHALSEAGEFERSSDIYRKAAERFPWQSVAMSGLAENYKDQGEHARAIEIYDAAILRFPDDARLLCSRANVFKRMGAFDEALQQYDAAIAKFPYEFAAHHGRADLLKELGHTKEAIKAYDVLIQRNPSNKRAVFSKAAVLAAMGSFDKALPLVGVAKPQTRDEWVALHVKAMIFLRTGKFDQGVANLQYGIDFCPFAKERRFFKRAMAVASMKNLQFKSALQLVESCPEEPLNSVLKMHAYGANKDLEGVQRVFNALDRNILPTHLRELAFELAAKYQCLPVKSTRDWRWIFERECDALLLAA